LIPLAKPQAFDDKEREKKKNERKNGEGAPRGEERCHSKPKQFARSLRRQPE
jgi:hypothetical protein